MTPLEKVAWAFLRALHDQDTDGFVEMTGVLENTMIDGQFDIESALRAAILAYHDALAEPTEGMLAAGGHALLISRPSHTSEGLELDAGIAWRAMLAAARREVEE